jgi:hypothetical protein
MTLDDIAKMPTLSVKTIEMLAGTNRPRRQPLPNYYFPLAEQAQYIVDEGMDALFADDPCGFSDADLAPYCDDWIWK